MNAEVKARVLGFLRACAVDQWSADDSCVACGWEVAKSGHAPECEIPALRRDVEAEPVDVAGRGPTIYAGTDGTSEVRR